MSTWDDWSREEAPRLEPGDYRVEITAVEETESRAGNPMRVVNVRPNGSNIKIKHYIVKNQYFNRNMTDLFDSFNIDEGDFNFPTWVGAVGAAKLAEDENGYLKVRWFISESKAEKLPPWQGTMPERQTVTVIGSSTAGFVDVVPDEDDFPF